MGSPLKTLDRVARCLCTWRSCGVRRRCRCRTGEWVARVGLSRGQQLRPEWVSVACSTYKHQPGHPCHRFSIGEVRSWSDSLAADGRSLLKLPPAGVYVAIMHRVPLEGHHCICPVVVATVVSWPHVALALLACWQRRRRLRWGRRRARRRGPRGQGALGRGQPTARHVSGCTV